MTGDLLALPCLSFPMRRPYLAAKKISKASRAMALVPASWSKHLPSLRVRFFQQTRRHPSFSERQFLAFLLPFGV